MLRFGGWAGNADEGRVRETYIVLFAYKKRRANKSAPKTRERKAP